MRIKQIKWRHFGDRDPKRPVRYLIVHCFAFPVRKNTALWDKLGVGPHYMIDEKGNIVQFVSEDKVAWHAGKSYWAGESGLNFSSIGIELYSPSFGQKPYPKAQINAFKTLTKDIMRRYKILPYNIIGHSDIAPTRKLDPNFEFPWRELALAGIGLWPTNGKVVSRVRNKTLLKKIGYDVTDEKAALLAFMRHFMPESVPMDRTDVAAMEEHLTYMIKNTPKANQDVRRRLIGVALAYEKERCSGY